MRESVCATSATRGWKSTRRWPHRRRTGLLMRFAAAAPARTPWPKLVGAAVLLAALGATLQYWRARPAAPDAVRLSLSVPGQFFTEPPSAVMSPDGRQLTFVSADASGTLKLWVRALDSIEARALPGTERADQPFWSPDARAIGFFADGQLKTVGAAGGPMQVVANAPVSPGATWNQAGTILFAQGGAIRKVSAAGGAVSPALTPPPGVALAWPHFLPDGRHFLYHSRGPQGRGVFVGSLDTSDTKLVLTSEFEAAYAPPGYLLFVRDESLMAQRFDTGRLEVAGEPELVATGAWVARGYGHGVFSAGSNGALGVRERRHREHPVGVVRPQRSSAWNQQTVEALRLAATTVTGGHQRSPWRAVPSSVRTSGCRIRRMRTRGASPSIPWGTACRSGRRTGAAFCSNPRGTAAPCCIRRVPAAQEPRSDWLTSRASICRMCRLTDGSSST